MSYSYTILTDSSSDLTPEVIEKLNLKVLPLRFTIEGETYKNYMDHREYPIVKFYNKLKEGILPTTSQVNTYEYIEAIKEEIDKGKDVLVLTFASTLSGSYNAARIAAGEFVNSKQKVMVLDTKSASLGEGLIVYLTALKRQAGYPIEKAYEYAESLIPHLDHWFTVHDLMYLKKGGRLSWTSARLGSVLRVKPVLNIAANGKLVFQDKIMGRKKALLRVVNEVKNRIDKNISNVVCVSHANDEAAVEFVKEKILALDMGLEVMTSYLGPVNGTHSGPGTIAVFFTSKERQKE